MLSVQMEQKRTLLHRKGEKRVRIRAIMIGAHMMAFTFR
jgi:hypothetical protein